MLDFSVAPYYDDFDQSKHFHKILFRPGRAVQSRDLTQVQSILQDQISKFADHIFTQNTPVSGGNVSLKTNSKMLILNYKHDFGDGEELVDVSVFLNKLIINDTSTVIGNVVAVEDAILNDNGTVASRPKLIVKYNTADTFEKSDTLYLQEDSLIRGMVYGVQEVHTVSISDGVFYIINGCSFSKTLNPDGTRSKYTLGHFVKVDSQTILVSEDPTPSVKIGLSINEHIIDHVDDPSLLDPALGASNYQAPGADRFVINLILESRDIEDTQEDFIELLRLKDGKIIRQIDETKYKELDDYFAKRTYETNGDYVVDNFTMKPMNNATDENKFDVEIGKGLAYVNGYRINNKFPINIEVDRARTPLTDETPTILHVSYGNYFYLDSGFSLEKYTFADFPTVNLYLDADKKRSIGTARIRNIAKDGDFRKLFVLDVKYSSNLKGTISFDDTTKKYTLTDVEMSEVDYSKVVITVGGKNYTLLSKDSDGKYTIDGSPNLNGKFIFKFASKDVKVIYLDKVISANVLSTKLGIFETNKNKLVFDITTSTEEIKEITDISYEAYVSKTTIPSSGTITLMGLSGLYAISDSIIVLDNSNNDISKSVKFEISGDDLTIKSNSTTLSNLSHTVLYPDSTGNNAVATKTLVEYNGNSKESPTTNSALFGVKFFPNSGIIVIPNISETKFNSSLSLYVSDVIRIKKIFLSKNPSITNMSTYTDVKRYFDFDNGQRDSYYDHASIKCKNLSDFDTVYKAETYLIIGFDYFKPVEGSKGFFCANSYGDVDRSIVPLYNNVSLMNCVDFRPVRKNLVKDFDLPENVKIPVIGNFTYKKTCYLPRKDLIVVNSKGEFSAVKGIEIKRPFFPKLPDDCLLLGKMSLDAYTYDVKKNVNIEPVFHKRWTMEEISGINSRVSTLEYYTALSLIEQSTQNIQIKNSLGQNRYKNGIFVDDFSSFKGSDLNDTNYSASIDDRNQRMTAAHLVEKFILDGSGAQKHSINGGITNVYTLGYSQETFIENTTLKNSSSVQILLKNDELSFGVVEISPPMDNWIDFEEQPDFVNSEVTGLDKTIKSDNILPFVDWKGIVGVETSKETVSNITNSKGKYGTVDVVGNFVKNNNIFPFLRPQHVLLKGSMFNITSNVKAFIGDKDVSLYVHKLNTIVVKTDIGSFGQKIANSGTLNYVLDYGYTHSSETAVQVPIYTNYYTGRIASLNASKIKRWIYGEDSFVNSHAVGVVADGNVSITNKFTLPAGDYTLEYYIKGYNASGGTIRTIMGTTNLYETASIKIGTKDNRMLTSDGGQATITLTLVPDTNVKLQYFSVCIYETDNTNNVVFSTNDLLQSSDGNLPFVGGGFVCETDELYLDENYKNSNNKAVSGDTITVTTTEVKYINGKFSTETAVYFAEIAAVDTNKITLKSKVKVSMGYNSKFGDITSTFTLNNTNSSTGSSSNKTNERGEFYGILQLPKGLYTGGTSISLKTVNKNGATTKEGKSFFFGKSLYNKTNSNEHSPSVDGIYDDFIQLKDSKDAGNLDPVAQTFEVSDRTYVDGVFVNSLTLHVKGKKNLKASVLVKIVKTANGIPNGKAIDYSTKVLYTDFTDDKEKSVIFEFDAPVFLDSGVYGLLVYCDNSDVILSVLDRSKDNSNKDLKLGKFFNSQNATNWTGDNTKELKMKMQMCNFNTNADSTIKFTIPKGFNSKRCLISNSNHNDTFLPNSFEIQALNCSTTDYIPSNTTLSYKCDIGTDSGGVSSGIDIELGKYGTPKENDLLFNSDAVRYINDKFALTAKMKTTSKYVSPVISDDGLNVFGIQYSINDLGLNSSQFKLNTSNPVTTETLVTFRKNTSIGELARGRITTAGKIIIEDPGSKYIEAPKIILSNGTDVTDKFDYVGELSPSGGNADCKYISKTITLSDENSSGDLKVYCTAYRPVGTNVYVFYKIRSKDDSNVIDTTNWQLMYLVGDKANVYSKNRDEVIEYEFSIDSDKDYTNTPNISYINIDNIRYDDFVEYKLKIVLATENKNYVPYLTNLRTIALPEY